MTFPGVLPFLLLLAAVLGLWIHRMVWITALAAAVASGYYTGALTGLAALWMLIAAALAFTYARARDTANSAARRAAQLLAGLAFLVFALAMSLPVLPGFTRVELVPAQVLSAGAVPYALAVGFPKVTTGILILGLINPVLSRSGVGRVLGNAMPVLLVTVVATAVYALSMGYTAFAPKWHELFLLWAPVNLFFVCLSEEAFFRGFVQAELARIGSNRRVAAALALIVAAMLFGLAHFAGGITYVTAGVIAGLGYGWAFLRTGRIEAAMAVHFGVNAVHFLLFVYPRLA